MKKLIFISLLFTFIASFCFANENPVYKDAPQEVKERIQKADKLISQKKYVSADKALGSDNNEYIIYKRVLLYTRYYSVTQNHKAFGLKDLSKKESLEEVRHNPKAIEVKAYDVPRIIADYEKLNGEKPVLKLALANYYDSVKGTFNVQKVSSFFGDVMSLIKENYKKAEEAGITDEYLWYNYAFYKFEEKDYVTAEQYYKRAIEINPNLSYAYHFLALIQVGLEKYDDAIASVKKAIPIEIFTSSLCLHYILLSDIYIKIKDYKNALKTLEEGEKKVPTYANFNIDKAYLYWLQGSYPKMEAEFLLAVKKDPSCVRNCLDVLLKMKDDNNLLVFCVKASKLHLDDFEYTGHLEYVIGVTYYVKGNLEDASFYFSKARTSLTKAGTVHNYEPDLSNYQADCR